MSLESQIQEKDRFIERLKTMHRQQLVEMQKALDRKHLEMVWGDNPNMAIGQAKKIGELEDRVLKMAAMNTQLKKELDNAIIAIKVKDEALESLIPVVRYANEVHRMATGVDSLAALKIALSVGREDGDE